MGLAQAHDTYKTENGTCSVGWTEAPIANFSTTSEAVIQGLACYQECKDSFVPVEVEFKYRKELVDFCTHCETHDICEVYGAGFVAKTSGIIVAIVALLFLVL